MPSQDPQNFRAVGEVSNIAEYRVWFKGQLASDAFFLAAKTGLIDIKAAKEVLAMGGSRSPNTTLAKAKLRL